MLTQERYPTQAQLVAGAVRELARRTRFPIAFGGLVHEDTVRVTSIVGNRTRSLDGLSVRPERGLGGRAMIELRPRMTPDYRTARGITHDYDGHVLGEGIASLLAVPVVVRGRARGVLYGGAWVSSDVGDVIAAPAFQVADALAAELRVREDVERRLAELEPVAPAPSPAIVHGLSASHREELRASYAELRLIAARVPDPEVRARIEDIERRLATLSGDDDGAAAESDVALSPRETDVLACAALGSTNAEIAATLGLREGTVKAYLSTAMAKLDASTRHAAVAKARRAGLLP
ncbi:MAG: helix-turn-helix transcriptional regulator [Microbacterium sp.]|uniref:LuxR C-terminal-related transcriptional regulator n=1 Tax=unclassified Microbacterium TaxID=2609290 RepID=UPI000DB1D956|nr:LuxR C-terminal-related transcriptional regulator [Microbacterium sp.]PZU41165.1 MAG: helix-turn-helix transcriptional regulator [Microbacterium sp.]